jgi:lipid-binding SYLF domain-containing protein
MELSFFKIIVLKNARGVAILPGVRQGVLGIGGRRGQGVMAGHMESGQWSEPALVSLTGVSGGRNAEASTDARLHAEILSYAKGRGLFVGASAD